MPIWSGALRVPFKNSRQPLTVSCSICWNRAGTHQETKKKKRNIANCTTTEQVISFHFKKKKTTKSKQGWGWAMLLALQSGTLFCEGRLTLFFILFFFSPPYITRSRSCNYGHSSCEDSFRLGEQNLMNDAHFFFTITENLYPSREEDHFCQFV